MSGGIDSLARVTKKDNELDVGIGEEAKVKVATRHLVDFIKDEDGGVFEQGGFPSGNAPGFGRGEFKHVFPFSSQFIGGNGNSEVRAEKLGAEELRNRERFAASSEPREMDQLDGALLGRKISSGIKAREEVAGKGGVASKES